MFSVLHSGQERVMTISMIFRDDNGNKMRSSTTANTRIEREVGGRLKKGMIIAGNANPRLYQTEIYQGVILVTWGVLILK